MRNKKTFIVIFLIVAMAFLLLLFWRLHTHEETVTDDERIKIILSDVISENFPVRNVSVWITEGRKIGFYATFLSHEFCEMADENMPDSVKLMLKLLPEETEVRGACLLSRNEEDGKISIAMESLAVNGYEISENLIPESFINVLADKLNEYIN